MITNAALLRIDAPAAPSALGQPLWTPGEDITLDCSVQEPSRAQRIALGATIEDATAAVYVLSADLPTDATIGPGTRLVVLVDGAEVDVTYDVIRVQRLSHGEQTHLVAYCREWIG